MMAVTNSKPDPSPAPAVPVELNGVTFGYTAGLNVLEEVSLSVQPGERVFLRGASGSGKSTLLGLVTGILAPTSGSLRLFGLEAGRLSGAARDRLRADRMGVIFQMFNLLPYLSVVGNVTLACQFSAARRARVEGAPVDDARRLLARLGLSDEALLQRSVRDLSVGQQQRVAVARALIGRPDLIIADEPTSALDADARDRFVELLLEEVSRSGASLLFVSHDAALGRHFDRAVDMAALNAGAVAA